jgi:hypothetical protein
VTRKLVSHRATVTLPSGTTITMLHLTPEAKAGLSTNGAEIPADYEKAVAECYWLQHDVPAQERTKRLVIAVVVAAMGAALMCLKPEVRWPIAAIIGMFEIYALASEYAAREESDDDDDDDDDD